MMSINFPTASIPPGIDTICAVCYKNMPKKASDDTPVPVIQTPCNHFFCRPCIVTWYQGEGGNNCPRCSHHLVPVPEVAISISNGQNASERTPLLRARREARQLQEEREIRDLWITIISPCIAGCLLAGAIAAGMVIRRAFQR